jgi:AP2 domain
MREIPLTKGQVALVPDEWYEYLSQYNWLAVRSGKTFYAYRNDHKDPAKRHGPQVIYMHRVILNAPKGVRVDHKDWNGLNNIPPNIRLATRGGNEQNRGKLPTNTSGYKGVHFCRCTGRWRAQIWVVGKKIELGRFYYLLDAARAYNEAAIKYHGEFAHLNEILEDLACCH